MRKLRSVGLVVGALGLLIPGATGDTTSSTTSASKKTASSHKSTATSQKKTATHQTATRSSGATVHKKTGAPAAHSTRATSSRRGKKNTRRTTWRNRQLTPTPERYKQIQEALAAKGYLAPDQANGEWNDNSAAALKKFQTDQNIVPSGKIDSLSLIALGLGPKHDTAPAQKPAEPALPASKTE